MKSSQLNKTVLAALVGAAALLGATGNANAHAFSIGYENAGANAATVWLGTYNHSVITNEGSLNLVGVNGNTFASTTVLYNQLVSTKPGGLIDGTTNFFVSTPLGVPGPLVGSDTIWLSTLCSACGPADHWQGATFTGLSAGDYQFTYVPRVNPTQEWEPYNDSLNGVFTISGAVLNPVPEPETYALMLAGLGVVGYMARRRKQERAAA